jgi:hypothetical protein
MKSLFLPTVRKAWFPVLLIALSVVPDLLVREIIFGTLALPYTLSVGHPPFPYHDKPWFLSPTGAFAVALVWAAIVYVIACLISRNAAGSGKVPIQPPQPTRS